MGVLDVYFADQIQLTAFPRDDAQQIAGVIADRLIADHFIAGIDDLGPSWLLNTATQPRR